MRREILLVIMAVILLLPANIKATETNGIYVEDFESYPVNASIDKAGFTQGGSATSLEIDEVDQNRCLHVARSTSASSEGWVEKILNQTYSGNVVLEYKTSTKYTKLKDVSAYGQDGKQIFDFMSEGLEACMLNNVEMNISGYSDGNLHSFKYVMKLTDGQQKGLIDFYYDGNLIKQDIPTLTTASEFYKFHFGSKGVNSSNDSYFDNIAVYNLENPVPATPVCQPQNGTLKSGEKITISADSGTQIYYTTDGSIPNISSILYTGSFQIKEDGAILHTIAYKDGVGSFVGKYGPYSANNAVFCDFENEGVDLFETLSGNAPAIIEENLNHELQFGAGKYQIPFIRSFSDKDVTLIFSFKGIADIILNGDETELYRFSIESDEWSSYKIQISLTLGTLQIFKNRDSILQQEISGKLLSGMQIEVANNLLFDDIAISQTSESFPNPVECSTQCGYMKSGAKISLSAEDGEVIYYTLDGSYPTSSSTKYTSPITPTSSVTIIKTVAIKNDISSFIRTYGKFIIDTSYCMDFDDYDLGVKVQSISFFDLDWGNMGENGVVNDNGNKVLYIKRQVATNDTSAWISKTLKYPLDNKATLKLKIKSTKKQYKEIAFGNVFNNYYLKFQFGGSDSANLGTNGVILNNSMDGNYHSYQFDFTYAKDGGGTVDFYYDGGKKLEGITLPNTAKNFGSFLLAIGSPNDADQNFAYVDDLQIYDTDMQIPKPPICIKPAGDITAADTFYLTADDGTSIYYTIDGIKPTINSKQLYSEPFYIRQKSAYIKAIAVKNGLTSTTAVFGLYNLQNINGITITNTPVFQGSTPASVTSCAASACNLNDTQQNVSAVLCLYKDNELLSISMSTSAILPNEEANLSVNIEKNSDADKAIFYLWSDKATSFAPVAKVTLMR